MTGRPLIHVVDDDDSMRRALDRLLRSAGFGVELFASAQEFLGRSHPEAACLVLDITMPGMTGLELQQHLSSAQPNLPLVIITAHGNEDWRQQALAGGASAYLCKPFRESDLLDALEGAIATA